MVAISVSGLMFCGNLGKTEGAPVGVSADDAAGADDLGTGVTGDSKAIMLGSDYRGGVKSSDVD